MNRLIFNQVKKIIPRISSTELIALRSGTVSLDGDIFRGEVSLPKKLTLPPNNDNLDRGVNRLLEKFGSQQQIYPSENINEIMTEIGDNKLLSLIIKKEWGGNHCSTTQLSSLLTKLSSVNPALGVTVMVPNSLGPAELLYSYGTKEQQDRFLYRSLHKLKAPQNQELLLELFHPASQPITQAINGIIEQERNSRFFTESEDLLRRYYLVIFLLMTLCIVFVATWLAFYFARGFVQPIEDLAQATQRVADGELGYQVKPKSTLDKDFGLLVRAFNSMSQDLEINQIALERTTEHLQQSHQALEEQHRLLELVLENISTGVVLLDPEGRIRRVNRAAHQLLPWRVDKGGENNRIDEVLSEDALPAFIEMWEQLQEHQSGSVYRHLTLIHQQQPIQVAVTLLTLQNRDNEPIGVIAVYNNITEIHRLQRSQAWREVARRIAHEIKNPLTPIQLASDRLRRKYKPENEKDGAQFTEYLSIIGRQVDDIGRMVDEFSAFARMPQPVMAPLDLHALVAGQMTLFEDGDIAMSLDIDDKSQEFGVLGDAGLLRQAVSNLIQNSVDSLHENRIKAPKITLGLSRADSMVILQIADNGPGYPEMDRSRLLEPYVTHREKGTGLGLAIVSKIVQDHAGTLELLDAPQGGACATIRLSFFEDMGSDQ